MVKFKKNFRGYKPSEVNAFLREINRGSVSHKEIYDKVFHSSFQGYDRDEVDSYLDKIIEEIEDKAIARSTTSWEDGIG